MKRRCDGCEFWERTGERFVLCPRETPAEGGCLVPEGECRIDPPKAGDSRWPLTLCYEWCGAFETKGVT